jgi:molecular chaperone GrpE
MNLENNADKNHNELHDKEVDSLQGQDLAQVHSESKESKNEVDMCLTELSIWKDQCKRVSADFENFKKRTEREQVRWADIAKEAVLYDLLSFVDSLDMALAQPQVDKVAIDMMYQSLMKILAKNEVKAMSETKEFDPQFHEAVMQVVSADHQSGEVVQFLSKGFMLKDKVLRPAKVSVAQ